MRALISVWDKQGIVPFAQGLAELGIELISTGNTHRILSEAGLTVQSVSEATGFPEILDGRVKTLHPAIHGGILARRDLPGHQQQLLEHEIGPIDMVVVNLYPFAQTVARPDVLLTDALEHIDIGGVALLRAAAKNFPSVLPLVEPDDYAPVLEALRSGTVSMDVRRRLAARAFAHTTAYDAAVSAYLSSAAVPEQASDSIAAAVRNRAPMHITLPYTQELRYGENPHQQAALYGAFFESFEQLHGKDLSYTNILDMVAAQELIEEFPPQDGAAVAIIKHTNPCGVGTGATLLEAWQRAFATDTQSSFGGIVALNTTCDVALVRALDEIFTEILIAPDFEPAALDALRAKKNRRLIRASRPITHPGGMYQVRSVPGGLLVQEADHAPLAEEQFTTVTRRAPTEEEQHALRFAWRIARHVKSNAIIYATSNATLGIGAGQMSRVDSSSMARWKAQHAGLSLEGAVIASDAFFPFPDGVETALAAGVTAIIQPGGSVRDNEVIEAADRGGAAMVFTGRRHFRH
jgi:phosphoribosylaminoimidazolecarboxamide formyltransferase/IMP cyclohydrolase